jgi:hypothetical protein
VGIHRYGSKIYYFFMAVNLVCVPIIWILYPETKGRPLEDMDVLFGGGRLVSMNDLSDRGSGESQHDETARLRLPRHERDEV